jgi:hypothetical protein
MEHEHLGVQIGTPPRGLLLHEACPLKFHYNHSRSLSLAGVMTVRVGVPSAPVGVITVRGGVWRGHNAPRRQCAAVRGEQCAPREVAPPNVGRRGSYCVREGLKL